MHRGELKYKNVKLVYDAQGLDQRVLVDPDTSII